ncbi:MAG TPA: sodium:solute symporter family protein [Clostridiales bacterium]|nr:sodium:solute symporter family protein [Clostridiales bacterium]
MWIQFSIMALYFMIVVVVGIAAKRKSVSLSTYHGENLGFFVAVAASTGEWLGGTSTIGISEYGYSYGISGAWYTVANGIGLLVLGIFFAKLYRSMDKVTIPGIIGNVLGEKARMVSSVFLIFVMLVVGTAQIIAAGSFGVLVLKLDFNLSVILLGAGFVIYTLIGGMSAVGYTSVLHFIIKYGGIILALVVSIKGIGSCKTIQSSLPPEYFNWLNIGLPRVSSWIIASVLGTCTAQAGIQPILAARDEITAKKASIAGALIVAPFGILTALLGMIARAKFPHITDAKLALPTLMINMNPVAGGIVLASVLAAILSTSSPIILACGTMFTKDIYQPRRGSKASESKLLVVSRISTAISGVICIALAIAINGSTKILDIVYFAYTIRGALFIVILAGLFWKKVSQKGAIISMFSSVITGSIWVVYKSIFGNFPIHPAITETYASVIVAIATVLVFSVLFPDKSYSIKNKAIT